MITEITSVIAVVLSVLYLGLQIRDNTKVLRSQAHYNALSLAQRPMEMMIENDGLATIVNTGYATPDALTADDWARFGNYVFIGFNAWEYLYYQNGDRSIPRAVGGRRRLLQGSGRDASRTDPVLVGVPSVVRRTVSHLRGRRIRQGSGSDMSPNGPTASRTLRRLAGETPAKA